MKPGKNDIFLYKGEQEKLMTAMSNFRNVLLYRKPHIKKYNKIRNMHNEIVNTMIRYYNDGKFKQQTDPNFTLSPNHEPEIYLLESKFDLGSNIGSHGFFNIWIYKTSPNKICITEDFIQNQRYKKTEKIEFLHSMLDSRQGLFEVTGTDIMEGYAYLKDVFTGAEHTIVDIGLSGNQNYDACYFYTRIITFQDISFSSGLNFIFRKTDSFIKNHIRQHKKDFKPNGEFLRFTQLYNYYSQDPDKVRAVTIQFRKQF